jgi:hypothetical protein
MPFTAEKWLTCTDPWGMLKHYHKVRNKSERKARLLACACCRCIWPVLADDRSRFAVQVAEDFADETASREQFKAAASGAGAAFQEARAFLHSTKSIQSQAASEAADAVLKLMRVNVWAGVEDVPIWALGAAKTAARKAEDEDYDELEVPSSKKLPKSMANLFGRAIHDVIGNPFRPAAFDAAWRGDEVREFGNTIYHQRAFDKMVLLGDALRTAGCRSEEILDHCRVPGDHYRGCWVLDLVLGKG